MEDPPNELPIKPPSKDITIVPFNPILNKSFAIKKPIPAPDAVANAELSCDWMEPGSD